MRMCRFQIVTYVSVLNFGPQLVQNCTFGPKKDFFQKLYLSNFHLLIAPYHAVKFGKNLSNRSCDISFHI